MGISYIQTSYKGLARNGNQDTCYVLNVEGKELLFIADGSTNAPNSKEFVDEFCSEFSKLWVESNATIAFGEIEKIFRLVHEKIRLRFICSKGSFLLLLVEQESDIQHCFFLGDCRVGYISNTKINWLNFPHSFTYAEGYRDEETLCCSPKRHFLYKTLAGKRYENPEYLRLRLDLNQPLILATDGFWSNFPSTIPVPLVEDSIDQYVHYLNSLDDASIIIRITENRGC